MASVSDSVPRVATESATLPTVAWLVQPPEGTVAPKRTALSIVHAAFPLAAIRLEKTSRNGQFLLSACGDGVSAICEIAELEKWEFSVAVAGAPFSGVAIAPSASGIAGHGSSGDPTMKAGSGSIVSSTSSSSASAEAASVCSQAAKTRRLQIALDASEAGRAADARDAEATRAADARAAEAMRAADARVADARVAEAVANALAHFAVLPIIANADTGTLLSPHLVFSSSSQVSHVSLPPAVDSVRLTDSVDDAVLQVGCKTLVAPSEEVALAGAAIPSDGVPIAGAASQAQAAPPNAARQLWAVLGSETSASDDAEGLPGDTVRVPHVGDASTVYESARPTETVLELPETLLVAEVATAGAAVVGAASETQAVLAPDAASAHRLVAVPEVPVAVRAGHGLEIGDVSEDDADLFARAALARADMERRRRDAMQGQVPARMPPIFFGYRWI